MSGITVKGKRVVHDEADLYFIGRAGKAGRVGAPFPPPPPSPAHSLPPRCCFSLNLLIATCFLKKTIYIFRSVICFFQTNKLLTILITFCTKQWKLCYSCKIRPPCPWWLLFSHTCKPPTPPHSSPQWNILDMLLYLQQMELTKKY